MRIDGVLRIRCAICKKFAERVETWRDDAAGGMRVVVKCHGEIDECVLRDHFVASANDVGEITVHEAFATKLISRVS